MKKNIAVIGCGHWGKNLVRNFSELGSLLAICDPDKNVSKKMADLFDVQILSFEDILLNKTIEGVVLAVPASLHADMAIKAMTAGKHVYVEKPLAMNNDEAQLMIESSHKNNVKLMVGHLLQYHPVFIKTKEIVLNGGIGKVNYIYSNRLSFGKVRSEEDVIWSFAPHDISMVLSLAQGKPKSVLSKCSCIIQEKIADTGLIHIDFEDGLRAHISVSWVHPFKEQRLVVVGSTGALVFDDTKPWKDKLILHSHEIDKSNDQLDVRKTNSNNIFVPESEPLKNECQHFVDVVNSSLDPKTSANEGQSVLQILSAATLSQNINKSVNI